MVIDQSLFDPPVDVPDDLRRMAQEKGWPDGLLERAVSLRVPRGGLLEWLHSDQHAVENMWRFLDWREQLLSGTLHVREATWSDDEALAELYANSPEEIGDWQVTVERSPYPFAQFRLQEHVNIQVLEDRGVILAAAAHSTRNTIIEGKRTSTHIASAWRVRKECRGQGMSNLLRMGSGPGCSWFGIVSYWYVRGGNYDAVSWIKALRPDLRSGEDGEVPGIPVTVHHFRAQPFEGDASGIRGARRSDTRQCIALINRTHRGLDLFRPYTPEYLHSRLDDPTWGVKPGFWTKVYCWEDYHALEERGRIVACAGLWDRGRHVREVWQHRTTGERQVIEPAALLDFGYAEGREDAMARLLGYLIGRTQELGRHELLAPLDQLPALLEGMTAYDAVGETRKLSNDVFNDPGGKVQVTIRRPYTDVAYW